MGKMSVIAVGFAFYQGENTGHSRFCLQLTLQPGIAVHSAMREKERETKTMKVPETDKRERERETQSHPQTDRGRFRERKKETKKETDQK